MRWRWGVTLAVIPLLGCAPARSNPAAPPRDCGVLCGTVVDAATGKPIDQFMAGLFTKDRRAPAPAAMLPRGYPLPPGVPVKIEPVITSGGRFDFGAIPVSSVTLVVSAHGYLTWQSSEIVLPSRTPLKISLNRAWQVRGRVVGPGGVAVAGASFYLDHPRAPLDEALSADWRMSQSDAAGRFTLDDIQTWQRQLPVIVRASGFLPHRGLIPIAGPVTTIDVHLEPAVAVSGTVTDRSGKPAPAWVTATAPGGERRFLRAQPDGRFLFDALPPRTVRFEASRQLIPGSPVDESSRMHLGYASDTAIDVSKTREIRLTLPEGGIVHGTMKGLARQGYLGYSVHVRCGDWSSSIPAGGQGEFTAAVPAGDCDLIGAFDETNSRYETDMARVSVADGSDVPVDLLFGSPTEVRLKLNGAAFGPLLTIVRAGESEPVAQLSAGDGVYRFAGIKPGRYEARFAVLEDVYRVPLEIGSKEEFSAELHTADPKLVLSDSEGRRLSGAIEIVQARYAEGEPEPVRLKFSPFLPFGEYDLRIKVRGYLPQDVTVRVPDEEKIVRLQPKPLPFSHPPTAASLPADERQVLAAVLQHYVSEAQHFWKREAKEKRAALHLLNQTAQPRVSIGLLYGEDSGEAEKKLATWAAKPGVRALERNTRVRSLQALSRSFVRLQPMDQIPLRPPAERESPATEIDPVDAEKFYERFPDAAGLLMLSRPGISGDDAYVFAALMMVQSKSEELVHLHRVRGQWTFVESLPLVSEPGC